MRCTASVVGNELENKVNVKMLVVCGVVVRRIATLRQKAGGNSIAGAPGPGQFAYACCH